MRDRDCTYFTLWVDSKSSPSGFSENARSRTRITDSATKAHEILADPSNGIAALLIDPVIGIPGGLELISSCRKGRPFTPIYILYEGTPPFSKTEMDRLGITQAVLKSEAPKVVEGNLAKEIFDSHLKRLPEECRPNADGFIPVPAPDFLSGTPAAFDIYLKLPSGKYIKIVEAKDVFTPSRALSYIRKEVTHFYLNKETYRRSLAYCDSLANHFLKNSELSLELKTSQVLNEGERVLQILKGDASEPEKIDYAIGFVMSTQSLLKQIKLEDHQAIQAITRSLPAYEHAVSSTLIAGLLGMSLEIDAISTFRVLGLAALLHDIGLYRLPIEIQHGDQSLMNEAQRKLYQSHPTEGAKILKTMPEIDDTVIQAVAQHHERRDNRGFPQLTKPTEINRIAEIIGLSGEFADLLARQRKQPGLNCFQEMEDKVFDGYSFPVVEAFRKVFINKPRKK